MFPCLVSNIPQLLPLKHPQYPLQNQDFCSCINTQNLVKFLSFKSVGLHRMEQCFYLKRAVRRCQERDSILLHTYSEISADSFSSWYIMLTLHSVSCMVAYVLAKSHLVTCNAFSKVTVPTSSLHSCPASEIAICLSVMEFFVNVSISGWFFFPTSLRTFTVPNLLTISRSHHPI